MMKIRTPTQIKELWATVALNKSSRCKSVNGHGSDWVEHKETWLGLLKENSGPL